MSYKTIRRLTPAIIEKSKYNFDVMWCSEKYMFIKLNEKPPNNILETVPVYDSKLNQYLNKDNLTLLDRYR